MAKYKFSLSERHAVYTVHGEKCYLCGCPLNMKTMEIDHIIPESLEDKPDRLKEVLASFGLPEDFELNSYANWKPACRQCNGKKLAKVFNPAPIILLELQDTSARAAEAKKIADTTLHEKKLADALTFVALADEKGQLTNNDKAILRPLVEFQVAVREPEMVHEPVRLLPLYEVISDDGLIQLVRGPYGVGGRPSMPNPHPSFDCPTCGAGAAFNGTFCVRCGTQSDGD